MTKDDLARKLEALGPGDVLPVPPRVLAAIFAAGRPLSWKAVEAASVFARRRRCVLSCDPYGRARPFFEKLPPGGVLPC